MIGELSVTSHVSGDREQKCARLGYKLALRDVHGLLVQYLSMPMSRPELDLLRRLQADIMQLSAPVQENAG